jgi:predicted nucleic acid-binding protein
VRGEPQADQAIAFTATCIISVLDTKIAMSAAALSAQHRLATADAIVYATVLAHEADLLTCDRHFDSLPNVHFVPRSKN